MFVGDGDVAWAFGHDGQGIKSPPLSIVQYEPCLRYRNLKVAAKDVVVQKPRPQRSSGFETRTRRICA